VSKNSDKEVQQSGEKKVLLAKDEGRRAPLSAEPDFGWYLIGWIGLVFTLVGGADLLLTWYPMAWGSPEWEFGTVTAALDGLPVPTLGLALLLGVGAARGQRWLMRTIAVAFALFAILIILAAIMYATNVPIALQAVQEPLIRTGLKKAITKSTIQSVVYPAAFLWIAFKAWRHAGTE
jgi:hypothetical protein